MTGLREIDPSVTALQNLPMMFDSLEEAADVRAKLRPRLEKRWPTRASWLLFWGDVGWVRFFSQGARRARPTT